MNTLFLITIITLDSKTIDYLKEGKVLTLKSELSDNLSISSVTNNDVFISLNHFCTFPSQKGGLVYNMLSFNF